LDSLGLAWTYLDREEGNLKIEIAAMLWSASAKTATKRGERIGRIVSS
jgi:hypothetical protein